MKLYKPLILKEQDEEGCPCEKCQKKESCGLKKEMCEANMDQCHKTGMNYDGKNDKCYKKCADQGKPDYAWNTDTEKCDVKKV
jgi:hypothetical protein